MDWKPGAHASTFGGNPVSCAAALATIKLEAESARLAALRQKLEAGLHARGAVIFSERKHRAHEGSLRGIPAVHRVAVVGGEKRELLGLQYDAPTIALLSTV